MFLKLLVCSILSGIVFHVIWNVVPCYLESCSILAGTLFQMICNPRTFIIEHTALLHNS